MKKESSFSTIVDALMSRSASQPDKNAYIFLNDGEKEEDSFTYGELDKQARSIGARLQKQFQAGERALLLYPPGLDFISGFFGCLYAGIIAVPCYPPDPGKLDFSMAKLQTIIDDCEPKIILTTKEFLDLAGFIFPDYPDLEKLNWLASDAIESSLSDEWRQPVIESRSLAFLQYTSGSTGNPKGVMVSHGNLISNLEYIRTGAELSSDDIGVFWLPVYHDMGLVNGVVNPVYTGMLNVLMSPIAFLSKPVRWLKAISRYKATYSGGPNFAYDLCARKIDPMDLSDIDLSSWRCAFSGAETIREATLAEFEKAFKAWGFQYHCFYPCYGLAEATVAVSGSFMATPPIVSKLNANQLKKHKVAEASGESSKSEILTGCGHAWPNMEIAIVDPESMSKCAADAVGEIWVKGDSVAMGYWNKPELSEKTFRAYLAGSGKGPFLRTGDLGFVKDGELFVTGRIKDLIIIRGRNHYPHDIESTLEQTHQSLRSGCGAAFSVEVKNEEKLVVVQEVKSEFIKGLNPDEVFSRIKKSISANHDLQVHSIVLIKPRSMPKTSSGKIQRRLCKLGFMSGKLSTIWSWSGEQKVEDEKSQVSRPETREEITDWLLSRLSSQVKMPTSKISLEDSVKDYGLDSMAVVEIQIEIDNQFGVDFPMEFYSENITVEEFCERLVEIIRSRGS